MERRVDRRCYSKGSLWRGESSYCWFADLSKRGVLPRSLELVDLLWLDGARLSIVHSWATAEVHNAGTEPSDVVLEEKDREHV